jgi:signal peptidase
VSRIIKNTLLALVCLALVVPAVLLVSGVLPYKVYVVHTGSMSPTIPSKSAVIVKKGVYRVGQVVSYQSSNGVVTHRLIKRSSDGMLVTKGDANRTADPGAVSPSKVIGGVVAAPRMLGYWLMYLKNPAGLASLLLTMICLWLIYSTSTEYSNRQQAEAVQPPTSSDVPTGQAVDIGPLGTAWELAAWESVAFRCSHCTASFSSAEKLRAHAAGHGGLTLEERQRLCTASRFVGKPFVVASAGSAKPSPERAAV